MAITASAASNNISHIGAIHKSQFPDLLNTNFKLIVDRAWSQEVQGLQHFKVESTSRDYIKESAITGIGLMQLNSDEDNLPVDTPIQGFDHQVELPDYRLSIRITERMREVDQFGKIGKLQSMLAQSPRDTLEYFSADCWNTGFDTTGQFLCGDGMFLFDSGRPFEDPRAGEWSNLETASALTADSLETIRLNFRANLNERGLLRPLNMQKIIVPPALEKKANELLKSSDKPETSLNDTNFLKGKFQISVWDYLTSTTAWFGCAAQDSLYELKWFWRVKPNFKSNPLSDNPDVYLQRVRMSFGIGCLRPHSLRGNAGA